MASVTLEGVTKTYGALKVVEAVDLRTADGEFMVLVGPSGCGKSTTLRMIAGLEETSGGAIHIGERNVTRMEPRDRNVAMVFQNYALYPHKSIYDNMAFGLRMRKTDRAEIDRRVRRAAGVLGITPLLDRRPRQLSGGQMQRVALGRALVREPDAFLLDEPLSNLDAKMRVHMREEIGRLHRQIGVSMIYVTHDQVEAMTLGDRICVMKDGRVQQVGAPLEVYDRPANRFVAGFIGSPEMNMLEGQIESGHFTAAGFRVPLEMDRFGSVAGGVVLGLRPEHLSLTAPGSSGSVPGRVTLIERMGSEMLVFLATEGGPIRAMVPRDDRVSVDDPVGLRIAPDIAHLFTAEDGRSLTKQGTSAARTIPGRKSTDEQEQRGVA